MRIGVIGTGTIASAVVEGLMEGAQDTGAHAHQVTVSHRGRAHSARLAARYEGVTAADAQAVIDASELVFLGMTADVAPQALRELTFRPDQKVATFMVGIPGAELAALVAPAHLEAQVIPFPSIAKGPGSPVLLCPHSPLLDGLFAPRSPVFGFEQEEALKAYLTAQAVLSPALKLVEAAAEWLAERSGDPEGADGFLRGLVGSTLHGAPVAESLEALSTPGGLNATLREHLEISGAYDALAQGLDQLEARLKAEG